LPDEGSSLGCAVIAAGAERGECGEKFARGAQFSDWTRRATAPSEGSPRITVRAEYRWGPPYILPRKPPKYALAAQILRYNRPITSLHPPILVTNHQFYACGATLRAHLSFSQMAEILRLSKRAVFAVSYAKGRCGGTNPAENRLFALFPPCGRLGGRHHGKRREKRLYSGFC
jgi:hypothetical protein